MWSPWEFFAWAGAYASVELFVGSGLSIAVISQVYRYFYARKQDAVASAADRALLRDDVASGRLHWGYAARMRALLDTLERWIEGENRPDENRVLRAWSPGLLWLTLTLAIIYPPLTYMLQWAFTGEAIAISAVDGDLVGLEAEASHLLRAFSLVVMLVAMIAAVYARNANSVGFFWRYWPILSFLILANILMSFHAGFYGDAGKEFDGGYIAGGSFMVAAGILIGGILGYITAAVSLFVFIGIMLPLMAGPINDFFRTTIQLEEIRIGGMTFIISTAGTFFAILLATLLHKFSEWRNVQSKKERKKLSESIVAAAVLLVIATVISLFIPEIFSIVYRGEAEIPRTIFAIFLIFLVQLPLVNGVFDWLSIGATRYLLRRGAESGPGLAIFMAVLDLVIGALIFIALACTTLFFTTFAKNETGVFYLELGPLFTEIALSPEKYWWLYATFFSTILPTLFHAFAASTAIYDGALSVVAPRALASLEKADAQQLRSEARWGVRLLAGAQTAGLVSAVFLTWTLLWALTAGGASSVAAMVFDLLIYWSKLIGALPWDWVKPASAAL